MDIAFLPYGDGRVIAPAGVASTLSHAGTKPSSCDELAVHGWRVIVLPAMARGGDNACAMSSDEKIGSQRAIRRPRVPPGPLADLKDMVYELYLEAGAPLLDEIAARVVEDDQLPGAPGRDTINRIIGGTGVPPSQADVVAVATVLARAARWDEHDAAARVRGLWVSARMVVQPGRPVTELTDPFALEVHPAIDSGARDAGLPVLPAYVERAHDAILQDVVRQAADGHSAMAVLVGESSTGKTRACWEAIHALPREWRLLHPIYPDRPDAVVRDVQGVGPYTVIWLNELQHYLYTPGSTLSERVAAGLRELLRSPERAPVLILGTIWPEHWAVLTGDAHPQARFLLAGTDISIPEATTSAVDLSAFQAAAASDPRLKEALTHAKSGQITQFLAGAPALMERYRNAPQAARALIHAAVDARRLGHRPAMPQAFLRDASAGYLNDQQWDSLGADWFERSLAYVTTSCRGVPGPLTRVRARPDQSPAGQSLYRLADYLEHAVTPDRIGMCPPASFWQAGAKYAFSPGDRRVLAITAMRRGRYRHAAALYEAAIRAGDASSREGLGELRRMIGDLQGASGLPEHQPVGFFGSIPIYEVEICERNALVCIVPDHLVDVIGQFRATPTTDGRYVAALSEILCALARLKEDEGDWAEADRLFLAAADAGHFDGIHAEVIAGLARVRTKAGDPAAGEGLRRFGLEADGSMSSPWW